MAETRQAQNTRYVITCGPPHCSNLALSLPIPPTVCCGCPHASTFSFACSNPTGGKEEREMGNVHCRADAMDPQQRHPSSCLFTLENQSIATFRGKVVRK